MEKAIFLVLMSTIGCGFLSLPFGLLGPSLVFFALVVLAYCFAGVLVVLIAVDIVQTINKDRGS